MDDYIKRSDAIKTVCGDCEYYSTNDCEDCRLDRLTKIPAADVQPVVYGHMIGKEEAEKIYEEDYSDYPFGQCSVCGHCDWDCVESEGFNYCPYCGKTMTNAERMVVRWPGYQETASPKWIAIKRGERGYSAGDFRCSECGKPNPCRSLTEYCPNCGEHMKEGT